MFGKSSRIFFFAFCFAGCNYRAFGGVFLISVARVSLICKHLSELAREDREKEFSETFGGRRLCPVAVPLLQGKKIK